MKCHELSAWLTVVLVQVVGVNSLSCHNNLNINFATLDRFTDNMCAQCLWFMAGSEAPWLNPLAVTQWQVKYNYSHSVNVMLCTPNCTSFHYDQLKNLKPEEYASDLIVSQLTSTKYLDILLDCCDNARECCMQSELQVHTEPRGHCPSKWDGFMCWQSASPSSVNYQSCPKMTYAPLGVKPTPCRNEQAIKHCLANGTWSRIWKSETTLNTTRLYQEEYTDYMKCSTPGATHQLRFIHVMLGVYSFSLVLTFVGVYLIYMFGPKPNHRTYNLFEIHKHFLISLIFTSVSSILVLYLIKMKHYQLDSMIDDK